MSAYTDGIATRIGALAIVGADEFQALRDALKAIKGTDFSTAQALLRMGYRLIDDADRIASEESITMGASARKLVRAKLDWHKNAIAGRYGTELYTGVWDLRYWVSESLAEHNRVATGQAAQARHVSQLYGDLLDNLAALPKDIGTVLGTVAKGVGQAAGGLGLGLLSGLGPVLILILGGGAVLFFGAPYIARRLLS